MARPIKSSNASQFRTRIARYGKIGDAAVLSSRWSPSPGVSAVLLVVLAVAGLSIRWLEFHRNYSLMMDECAISMNIFDRNLSALTKPLDYDQAAPLGYMVLQKLFFRVFGMGDRTTRMVPLFFGILTVPLGAVLFARIFHLRRSAWPWILSTGLICLNRGLVSYSGISKQYTLECCVTLILLHVFCRELSGPDPVASGLNGQGGWMVVLSPLLVWLSYGAVFVLTGFGAALVGRAVLGRRRNSWPLFAWFSVSFFLNLLIFFLLSARAAMADEKLSSMWTEAYMPLWPPLLATKWLWQTFTALGEGVIHLRLTFLLPLGLLTTCIYATWQRSWFWLGCAGSIFACLCASALKRYPLSGRLTLFLLPIMVLMLAKAVDLLSRRSQSSAAVVAMIALFAATSSLAHQIVIRNNPIDRVREVHRAMLAKLDPGDQLWVAPYSQPCLRYYIREYPVSEVVSVHFLALNEMPTLYPGRHWLLAMRTPWSPSEGERLLDYFSRKGTRQDTFDVELTTARLFIVPRPQ
jgi:hypothetical protein